jgi:hypothetical protein
MKTLLKFCMVSATVLAFSAFASADTIQLGSFATGQGSLGNANTAMNFAGFSAASNAPLSGVASTSALAPDSVWLAPVANSTWVGYAVTAGPVGTSNPDLGYYTFTTSFTVASAGTYAGSLSIVADDTAEVLLNGAVLMPFGILGSDAHCADSGISCLGADTFSFTNLSLLGGLNANTLTFVVRQAGTGTVGGSGDPSGLDFDANLTSTAAPEPGSLLLLATGLIGSGVAIRRRIRS